MKETFSKALGEVILDLRKEKGLSQSELSMMLKYQNPSSLCRMEKGARNVTLGQIGQLCETMNMKADRFLFRLISKVEPSSMIFLLERNRSDEDAPQALLRETGGLIGYSFCCNCPACKSSLIVGMKMGGFPYGCDIHLSEEEVSGPDTTEQ